jgi:hypothetical protein
MKKLKSYSFNDAELDKMDWLKELFQENGFTIERFPEVYYDTFDNACLFHPSLNDPDTIADIENHPPDYLGVYLSSFSNVLCDDKCHLTQEGIIILFSDRIEEFSSMCKKKIENKYDSHAEIEQKKVFIDVLTGKLNLEDAIREMVLYHEIGHWLSHWPKRNGLNWECGYHTIDKIIHKTNDKITHESLAQLVAYWCANGNPINEIILKDHLTPNNQNSPYYMYLNLIGKSVEEILNKLVIIRKYMGCNPKLEDNTAYEFLKMDTSIDELVAFANTSIRKIYLDKIELNRLKPETILEIFIFSRLNEIEYDYALCLMDKEGLLDETSKDILKFDNRLCIN